MENDQPTDQSANVPNAPDKVPAQPEGQIYGEKVIQPVTPDMPRSQEATSSSTASQEAAMSTEPAPAAVSNSPSPASQAQSPSPLPIQPSASAGSSFVTGSQIQQEKPKLPIGVYFIAGLTLLGAVSGFFDNSQWGIYYTIAMLVDLMLVIGLIFRIEAARKLVIGLSVIILILAVACLLLLTNLRSKLEQSKAKYEAAVSQIDQSRITGKQKQALDQISETTKAQEKQIGSALTFLYARLGITAVLQIVTIIYLTRPKVKEVFEVST